jgi:hypothetical protein
VTDSGGSTIPTKGEGTLKRTATNWRFETSWRPHRDWEFTASAESDDVVDDEYGYFEHLTKPPYVDNQPHARITDRAQRYSLDATWDATDEVRLRLGEQYLREQLFVPTDSHFNVPNDTVRNRPTDLSSGSWRTTAGADWKATKKLTLSALARISTNDNPQTTTVADHGNEYSLRSNFKATDELTLTSVLRRRSVEHTGAVRLYEIDHVPDPSLGEHPGQQHDLDSASRWTSLSHGATWSHGAWTVSGNGTYRRFDTSTDTAWGASNTGALTYETVRFEGSDVSVNLDVRYDFTKALRVFGNVTRTNSNGDYTALWTDISVGGEYDVRKDVTVGVTLSEWRLNEKHGGSDDYSTYGAEVSVTYRF